MFLLSSGLQSHIDTIKQIISADESFRVKATSELRFLESHKAHADEQEKRIRELCEALAQHDDLMRDEIRRGICPMHAKYKIKEKQND